MKRATIKDIAAIAGVNVSTVSRALRDHPDIGLALRTKIKQLAHDMHYHPNMLAVQLRKQKSNTIGLIIPEANMYFIPSVIKGISDAVQKAGYRLLVLQSGESFEQEIENVNICNEYGVEGLLISLTNVTEHLNHLNDLKDAGIPVVLMDKILDNTAFDQVIIDDVQATQLCVNYLIEKGCKRIFGLFGNANMMITHKRLEGFNHTIGAMSPSLSIISEHKFVDNTFLAWACVEQVFPVFQPDAIFAMSDEIIAGVIPALKKMKIQIPEQCSVIGFSDGYLPQILDPQVSFLHHDGFALGKMAATHLLKKLTDATISDGQERLILPTELVINHSTRS
jgi:LacI family transcriptional regulator